MLATNALALLTLAASVSANGISLSLGTRINLGASASLKASASASLKSSCTGKGDFLTALLDEVLCCSSETRTTPESGLTCPFNWGMHKTAKCCIPSTESATCDCGEGYTFNENTKKCTANSGSCSSSQWWHERSSSCCDKSWSTSPPKGTCPSGVTCPTDWFWHKTENKCKPLGPRSPEPDCDDWNSNTQCCGGASASQAASNGKGHGKRSFKAREQTALFPQTALDKTYCPNGLHACTINGSTGGEWSYECIDPVVELEACGGCIENGGQDCTTIANALSVGCSVGTCEVFSCKFGYQPAANGTSCIAI